MKLKTLVLTTFALLTGSTSVIAGNSELNNYGGFNYGYPTPLRYNFSAYVCHAAEQTDYVFFKTDETSFIHGLGYNNNGGTYSCDVINSGADYVEVLYWNGKQEVSVTLTPDNNALFIMDGYENGDLTHKQVKESGIL